MGWTKLPFGMKVDALDLLFIAFNLLVFAFLLCYFLYKKRTGIRPTKIVV